MIGVRKMLSAARRPAPPTWTLVMQFDQPDLMAANKPGVVAIDAGYGATLTPVAGKFGDGAAVPPVLTLNWSAADGFAAAAAAAAAADATTASDWTLEFWVRSPDGEHKHWIATPSWSYIYTILTLPGTDWTHFALCRSAGVSWMFLNGVPEADPGLIPAPPPDRATLNFHTPWDAQYDALRMTVGAALYTAPFTPPTSPPTT